MNSQLSFQQKYNAIGTKDAQFEGVFITAVKTTGIFCRPSCRARKPKQENVEFYDSVHQAMQNQGVLVKNLHGSHALLADCLRLTVGTADENKAQLAALKTSI